jgi:DNA-binding transcriptional ArsR family regulator
VKHPNDRDPTAVSQAIERLAGALTDAGMPRMPARVFTALLASDDGRRTAGELGELLAVSPAGVSGAIRYLGQVGLASRERDPGSRRDHYRVREDVWYELGIRREPLLATFEAGARAAMEALGPDTDAGRRMAETVAYFAFLREELPGVVERWEQRRAALRAAAQR